MSGGNTGGRDWNAAAVYSLGLLTLISAFNYFDRSILSLVLPAIKAEMQLSDTMLGLLVGFGFALFNATLGVPIARLADRWNRRNVIAAGLAFWSLMTALTGWVTNVWQLALARFLMGAGEAAGSAPSNSLLSDLFSRTARPMAISVFATGSSLGILLFTPVAGWLADHYGWRSVFVAAGIPGMLLAALLLLTVREPTRGATESAHAAKDVEPFGQTLRFLFGSKAYLLLVLGGAFVGVSIHAASWHATFLSRVHHLSLTEIGYLMGPIRGVFGVLSVLLGGFMADRLGRLDERWRMRAPAIACILVGPAELLFLFGPTTSVALTGLAAASLLGAMSYGPTFAACMSVAKVRMRALAVSIFFLFVGLLGQIIGPLAVGYLNDRLQQTFGDAAIRYSLIVSAACIVIGGCAFMAAAHYLPRDTRRAAAG